MSMLSPAQTARIRDRWLQTQQEVADATLAAGRPENSVTIVGVTKYVDHDSIQSLVTAGCYELGESRPQQLWDRAPLFTAPVHWHLIGHLQTNKVAKTVPLTHLIHSVDSLRLLQSIEEVAKAQQRTASVLLEVKVSADATKQGLDPNSLDDILNQATAFTQTEICGFMGMASLEGGLSQARIDFAKLREVRDALQARWPAFNLKHLSMGMSDDFPAAIAEGATIVRIGSRLWE
jgi:PLP dependent protein